MLAISSMLQIKDSFSFFFSQNNLDIDLTYTTHDLNNFNKYPSITCIPIKQLVFPIVPFLTSGSVQLWSGSMYQYQREKQNVLLPSSYIYGTVIFTYQSKCNC